MVYKKIVKEAEALMRQKCEEKRKAGTLSKAHEESHQTAVGNFGAATARALMVEPTIDPSTKERISELVKIAGYLHDCEREKTEKIPHDLNCARFVLDYWYKNWQNDIPLQDMTLVYNAIVAHEGNFADIRTAFGTPTGFNFDSIAIHSIIAGDKAFEASGYRVLERRSFFVGKERTEKGDLKGLFRFPDEAHLSVLGETIIRLYAKNPIDAYPDWLKLFAQEWHAIQYQFYKGLLVYTGFDETKAAEFFLGKGFPVFDQKLVDKVRMEQHLAGEHFDKTKYPRLATEIGRLNGLNEAEKDDLAASSHLIVKKIAVSQSAEVAIEEYKREKDIVYPKNYRRFFNGIINYREGAVEFVKAIEDKIRAEVEKLRAKG